MRICCGHHLHRLRARNAALEKELADYKKEVTVLRVLNRKYQVQIIRAVETQMKCPRRGTGRCRRRGRLGSWASAFGGAGLGRLGEWRPPPRPQLFSFLFFCFLCTDEGLSSRVAERSSAVRGCRAALGHVVLFVCCLLRLFLFRPVVYPFFLVSTGV